VQAKRAEEVRALKEWHQREVAALEEKLHKAAEKPRKKNKRGRAGSPGTSGSAMLPNEALQQENAALKRQVCSLSLTRGHGCPQGSLCGRLTQLGLPTLAVHAQKVPIPQLLHEADVKHRVSTVGGWRAGDVTYLASRVM